MDRNRRCFFSQLTMTTAALGLSAFRPAAVSAAQPGTAVLRRTQAEQVRMDAARLASRRPMPQQSANGDDDKYETHIGSYSKGLPHNGLGEVDRLAYARLVAAVQSGQPEDFERIPLGGTRLLVNPQAGLAFDLEGADSHHLAMRAAPSLDSREAAAELIELYWMALARDVHFSDYPSDAIISAASTELSGLPGFRGPRRSGVITPETLFRGNTVGDVAGPYLSQFLWMDIPMGAVRVPQRMNTLIPHVDYLTDYEGWLRMQDGFDPGTPAFDPQPRYIRNLRDLAQWVHVDALYQAYHQACLILLGLRAPLDRGNPYFSSACQEGFGTFGGPHILSLVTEVATRALKAVWYQKWFVHRRLRPEALAGLVHHRKVGTARYPVSQDVLNAEGAAEVFRRNGTFLLPMAFPEGSPLHPSYGAGHATVAGACVTILKAWFDESFVLPEPVIPDANGFALLPYDGPDLTVGGELNKLAANVAIGRNAAGVHYRSDYWESVQLGEALAISVLEEQKLTYNEASSFSLTKFDGTPLVI